MKREKVKLDLELSDCRGCPDHYAESRNYCYGDDDESLEFVYLNAWYCRQDKREVAGEIDPFNWEKPAPEIPSWCPRRFYFQVRIAESKRLLEDQGFVVSKRRKR